MKLSKKLFLSILATASLFGISLANQNNHQANASMRHYTRYINGNYNAYHNVPGRRNAYLMHYGRNYRNDRVSTYGTYYKFGRHYTKINRARRWFGYMNVKGLNTRPIRVRVRRHAYRRPIRHTYRYRKPVRRIRRHKVAKRNPYLMKNYKEYEDNNLSSGLSNKGLHVTDLDALHDLNQIRESKGVQPLKWDANLQKIADIRVKQVQNTESFSHVDPNTDTPYTEEIANKYNIPYNYGSAGENATYNNIDTYSNNPKTIGRYENESWSDSPSHIETREDSSYALGAIAINNEGSAVEEFANNSDN